jgi:dTDP-4-amino-4,6-dideoxygalactose transaminase
MAEYSIPFNRPAQVGTEFRYVQEALERGKISGDGEFTRRCQAILERELGAARVLLTTSCTHALEMTALLLDIQPGDEIILPSFTFVSSVNAYALRGARPVFADIRPDTLNLDERQLDSLVTERTRVIMPVHYAGVACEMAPILAAAARVGAEVVEDNAHGFLGKWHGRMLGSLGALSTLSFHETKNFTAGEGGAIVVNDPRYVERAEIVREKGTNRTQFFRGEIDRYSWVDLGSSYVPSDLLAAFLYAQLEERERIQATRGALWERYREHLTPWAGEHGVRLPIVPAGCLHTPAVARRPPGPDRAPQGAGDLGRLPLRAAPPLGLRAADGEPGRLPGGGGFERPPAPPAALLQSFRGRSDAGDRGGALLPWLLSPSPCRRRSRSRCRNARSSCLGSDAPQSRRRLTRRSYLRPSWRSP